MNKHVATLALVFSIALNATAQLPLNTVVQRYNNFKLALPSVQLHFVFNQDKYAPGDTVYFKTYFLKDGLQPVQGRQLIELDLVASGGHIVQHFLFPVANGAGSSQLVLPETLLPGIYLLTAHSNWVKNFEVPPLFKKELFVVGEKSVAATVASKKRLPLQVSVSANTDNQTATINLAAAAGSAARFQTLYLLIVSRNKIIFSKSFVQGVRDRVSIDVGKNGMLPGMNIIHVLDKLGREVGTGSYYWPESNHITASIESNEPLLKTRKKATLSISILDDRNPVSGEFSVRILNAGIFDSTQVSLAQSIAYSVPSDESWHQVLYERIQNPRYNYITDLSKTGTVYFADGVTPVPAGTRLFFYMHENDVMVQTSTTKGGKLKLLVPDIYGNDNLFYMAELASREEIPGVKIGWDNETISLPSPPPSTETRDPDAFGLFAANKLMIDKAFDFDNSTTMPSEAERLTGELENRLQEPDITIRVDDYVTFGTMDEMIREIIPALKVRKMKGRNYVQIGLQQGIPESEPLYIIDGVASKDTEFFLSLKPVDLLNVKLLTNPGKLTSLGLMSRSGIVIIDSKAGNVRQQVDASRFVEGINRPIVFRQPGHGNSHHPDFRSTIYWNPMVKTDATGKAIVEFECSDDLGPVNVRVDGTTIDGRPFSAEKQLNFVLTENK